MNISSHTILCNKFKIGQFRPDGSDVFATTSSLTQFFPFVLSTLNIFCIPTNWREIYGSMYLIKNTGSRILLESNNFSVSSSFNIYDTTVPIVPSKPFSLILY